MPIFRAPPAELQACANAASERITALEEAAEAAQAAHEQEIAESKALLESAQVNLQGTCPDPVWIPVSEFSIACLFSESIKVIQHDFMGDAFAEALYLPDPSYPNQCCRLQLSRRPVRPRD